MEGWGCGGVGGRRGRVETEEQERDENKTTFLKAAGGAASMAKCTLCQEASASRLSSEMAVPCSPFDH